MRLEVDELFAGKRLDRFLVARVPHMSRAKAKRLIEAGTVRINGKRCRKGARLETADVVHLEKLPGPTEFRASPNAELPLEIAFESADIVCAVKPAQMATQPLDGNETDTLVNALVARYPEMADVGYSTREPGILHRLDIGTSGLVLAARNAETFDRLRTLLREGGIDKRYLALCDGHVEAPDSINAPIARKDAKRTRACRDEIETARFGGKPARTEILSSKLLGGFSLVEVRAPSARRHQVRVHLAHIGHPLVGDDLYEGPSLEGIDHHFLHAHALRFEDAGGEIDVTIDLPPDLAKLLV